MSNFYGQYVGFGAGGAAAPFVFQGTQFGYQFGGYNLSIGAHDYIMKYAFTSDSAAIDVGNTPNSRHYRCSTGAITHGYVGGGASDGHISKRAFASDGDGSAVGSLIDATHGVAGSSNGSYGFWANGYHGTTGGIEKICVTSWASDGDATNWADTANTGTHANTGWTDAPNSYGYRVGGEDGDAPYPKRDYIDKFTQASQSTGSDVGNILVARSGICGFSSLTYGFCVGHYAHSSNVIEWMAFASGGNSSDHADLNYSPNQPTGTSATAYGYIAGGSEGASYRNYISKIAYTSTGTASDVNDLNIICAYAGGTGANY